MFTIRAEVGAVVVAEWSFENGLEHLLWLTGMIGIIDGLEYMSEVSMHPSNMYNDITVARWMVRRYENVLNGLTKTGDIQPGTLKKYEEFIDMLIKFVRKDNGNLVMYVKRTE